MTVNTCWNKYTQRTDFPGQTCIMGNVVHPGNPLITVSSSYNLSHSTTSKVTITWICKLFTTHIHCAHCTNVFLVPNLRLFIEIQ